MAKRGLTVTPLHADSESDVPWMELMVSLQGGGWIDPQAAGFENVELGCSFLDSE